MAQLTTPETTRRSLAPRDAVDSLTYIAPLAGRILLSLIFLMSGVMKFVAWDQTAGHMASKGMPLIPVLLPLAALVELAGGLSILLGWQARLGALLLFLYLIPTTLIFHNFWSFEGAEQQNQMIHFMKNLAIMGGLLVVAGLGAGPIRLDRRAAREPMLR